MCLFSQQFGLYNVFCFVKEVYIWASETIFVCIHRINESYNFTHAIKIGGKYSGPFYNHFAFIKYQILCCSGFYVYVQSFPIFTQPLRTGRI